MIFAVLLGLGGPLLAIRSWLSQMRLEIVRKQEPQDKIGALGGVAEIVKTNYITDKELRETRG